MVCVCGANMNQIQMLELLYTYIYNTDSLPHPENEYINRSFILYCLLFPPSVFTHFSVSVYYTSSRLTVFFSSYLYPSLFPVCVSVSVVQIFFRSLSLSVSIIVYNIFLAYSTFIVFHLFLSRSIPSIRSRSRLYLHY